MNSKKFLYILFFLLFFDALVIFNEEISLGIVLGEPNGLSLKLQKNKNFILDTGIGFNTKENYFLFCLDFLRYDYGKIKSKEITGKIPVFYGLGMKMENTKKDTLFGIRFVCGVEYIFEDIPFNIFVKIVPTLNLVPETSAYIYPSIGIRYILK
ncbi:MAG: hypothetical protein ACK4WJ_01215 [Endomicrobiia bacterium]